MKRPLRYLVIATGLAVPLRTEAQAHRGTVAGVVSDESGHGVLGARVEVVDTDIRSTTDESGRYVLAGVWPGRAKMNVRHLGFGAETLSVVVTADDTTRANVRLSIFTLPTSEVTADAAHGRMEGFMTRKAGGVGGFITHADIEKRHPAMLSEMLRYVPGINVGPGAGAGSPQTVRMQRSVGASTTGVCPVQLYVDGHPYRGGNVDDFPPETVEGMEVYRSASEIPAIFRLRDAGCGLIAIWTRDPDSARREP